METPSRIRRTSDCQNQVPKPYCTVRSGHGHGYSHEHSHDGGFTAEDRRSRSERKGRRALRYRVPRTFSLRVALLHLMHGRKTKHETRNTHANTSLFPHTPALCICIPSLAPPACTTYLISILIADLPCPTDPGSSSPL